MKPRVTIFLQVIIVLIAIAALVLMIRLPMAEGRAKNLDWVDIYLDPFLLYGYAASIALFVGLYKAFKLLGHIRQNQVFSQHSVNAIRSIEQCAIAFSILIVAAGIYIRIFHAKDDDPAGFLAICMVIVLLSMVVAAAAEVFKATLQKGLDLKSENETLTAQLKK